MTTAKFPLLLDKEKALRDAQKAVKVARETLLEVKRVLPLLPEALANQNWFRFHKRDEGWYLETWGLNETNAEELVKQLKLLGVQGLTAKYKGGLSDSWYYRGTCVLGDELFEIMIDGGSKPDACRIEETTEWKEVKTYKAICSETGEEVPV